MKAFPKTKSPLQRILSAIVLGIVLLSCGVMSACSKGDTDSKGTGSQTGKYSIKYAKQFSIDYYDNGCRVLTDSDGRKLLLAPEGATAPAGTEGLARVTVPVKKVVYLSTTQVGMLGGLGDPAVYETVAGVSTARENWTNPEVLKRFEEGTVRYLPEMNTNNTNDIEGIIEISPDLVFVSGGFSGGSDLAALLESAGINSIVDADWLETGSYAYAEWIKVFGAVVGMDDVADTKFEEIIGRVEALKAQAAAVNQQDPQNRPLVAYGNWRDGIMYTPSGSSTVRQEIEAAGGRYFYEEPGEGNLPLTMEEWFDKARDADIFICTGMVNYGFPDKQSLLEKSPFFSELKSFDNDRVYALSASYYMNSEKIDVKFSEMVAVINPSLNLEFNSVFFTKLK